MLALALLLLLSCSRPSERPQDEKVALGGDVAARVDGSQAIPLSVIRAVAEAQNIHPEEAARRVIDDEIAASAARRRGMDQRVPASWRLTSARAGFTLAHLSEEAKAAGGPTDEEIDVLTERHWVEFARPPAVRVIHAIVLRPKDKAAAAVEQARSLAADVRRAVSTATTDAEFESSAKSVSDEVRVERLPPFTDDGWITEGSGRMDPTFSKGAFTITTIGGLSAVVESSFGWHVIRLQERIPEKMVPLETRRVAFAAEVETMRSRKLLEARLQALHAAHPVEISPAAEQLMRSVSIAQEGREPSAKAEQP